MFVDRHIEKLNEFHDKYANYYNSHDSKILAFAELTNVFNGVNNLMNKNRESLEYYLEKLKESFLNDISISTEEKSEEKGNTDYYTRESQNKLIDECFERLQSRAWALRDIEVQKKELIDTLNKVGDFKEDGPYSDELEFVLGFIESFQKIEPNLMVVRYLRLVIIAEEYPQKIALHQEFGKDKNYSFTVENAYSAGNPKFINSAYDMPEGFYETAIEFKKNNWDQESTYHELIKRFQGYWTDSVPSFATIRRRLKENEIW